MKLQNPYPSALLIRRPPTGQVPVPGRTVALEGSKSLSNRALILRALCEDAIRDGLPPAHQLSHLSPSEDTSTLLRLLRSPQEVLDAGAAGTTYRFLTAYLARGHSEHTLTGSARMLERPIGILVEALRSLGADISYLGREGYPPLCIRGRELSGGRVRIPADVSSQYISALLMIGPGLRGGLELELIGKAGSRPYIAMTLRQMQHFGAEVHWEGNIIRVQAGTYQPRPLTVEGDWSAASYYYGMMALAEPGTRLGVEGLQRQSAQGDSVLAQFYQALGVQTTFTDTGLELRREGPLAPALRLDFSDCPDLAQTMVVSCAALGVGAEFSGLESLRIKETDRTAALRDELAPLGAVFEPVQPDASGVSGTWKLSGRIALPPGSALPRIRTYEDHRMAMAFAPLAAVLPGLIVEDPAVVRKSYPGFWQDWAALGFELEPCQ
jgi:3-phosphoshikimate 1-carboxyvinyltransferase